MSFCLGQQLLDWLHYNPNQTKLSLGQQQNRDQLMGTGRQSSRAAAAASLLLLVDRKGSKLWTNEHEQTKYKHKQWKPLTDSSIQWIRTDGPPSVTSWRRPSWPLRLSLLLPLCLSFTSVVAVVRVIKMTGTKTLSMAERGWGSENKKKKETANKKIMDSV